MLEVAVSKGVGEVIKSTMKKKKKVHIILILWYLN